MYCTEVSTEKRLVHIVWCNMQTAKLLLCLVFFCVITVHIHTFRHILYWKDMTWLTSPSPITNTSLQSFSTTVRSSRTHCSFTATSWPQVGRGAFRTACSRTFFLSSRSSACEEDRTGHKGGSKVNLLFVGRNVLKKRSEHANQLCLKRGIVHSHL